MEVEELLKRLVEISGLSDFLIIKAGYNEEMWGRYFIQNKVIVIYNLDEYGEEYSDNVIVRIACHELAHHIQHLEGKVNKEDVHGEYFKELNIHLLSKFYIDKGIPKETLKSLEEDGLLC